MVRVYFLLRRRPQGHPERRSCERIERAIELIDAGYELVSWEAYEPAWAADDEAQIAELRQADERAALQARLAAWQREMAEKARMPPPSAWIGPQG